MILPEEELAKLDVVIINDGTPDRSAEIARRYETRYPDVFRVFDQENRGHGGAWNHGTELAVGKYLFYLDSDDWYDTGELSRLLKYLETCNTDMVMLNCMMYYATSGITKINSCHPSTFEPERVYETNQFDWCQCKDRFWL